MRTLKLGGSLGWGGAGQAVVNQNSFFLILYNYYYFPSEIENLSVLLHILSLCVTITITFCYSFESLD